MEQPDYFKYAIYYSRHTFSTSKLPSIGKTKYSYTKINQKTRLSIMTPKPLGNATNMTKLSKFLNYPVPAVGVVIIKE